MSGRDVVVLCGSGGNSGGGMVAARRLALWGGRGAVVRDDPGRPRVPEVAHQLDVFGRIGVLVMTGEAFPPRTDLVVDALVGYGLRVRSARLRPT